MKRTMILLISLLTSLSVSAKGGLQLSCSGLLPNSENYLVINGELQEGEVLSLGEYKDTDFNNLVSDPIQVRIHKIDDTKSFIRVIGETVNLAFLGGGSQNIVLMIPKMVTVRTTLSINTETLYNSSTVVYELDCASNAPDGSFMAVKVQNNNAMWFDQIDQVETNNNPMWFDKIEQVETNSEIPHYFDKIEQVD